MLPHILIFLFITNLALGAWVFSSVKAFSKQFDNAAARALTWHIIFYNLLISFLLIKTYVNLNLGSMDFFNRLPFSDHVIYLLGTLPFIGMFFSMLRFYYALLDRRENRTLRNGFIALFIILWICYGLYAWFLEAGRSVPVLHFIYNWILDNELLFEIVLLILLLVQARTMKTRNGKRMIRAFAMLFLTRYIFLGILLPVPGGFRLLLFTFVLFYANLCPEIWISFWYRPYLQSLRELRPEQLAAFSSVFGLTKREQDILYYVLTGHSNKSIEQSLDISYHTVKHHLSHILHKCSAANRLELAQQFHEQSSIQE